MCFFFGERRELTCGFGLGLNLFLLSKTTKTTTKASVHSPPHTPEDQVTGQPCRGGMCHTCSVASLNTKTGSQTPGQRPVKSVRASKAPPVPWTPSVTHRKLHHKETAVPGRSPWRSRGPPQAPLPVNSGKWLGAGEDNSSRSVWGAVRLSTHRISPPPLQRGVSP